MGLEQEQPGHELEPIWDAGAVRGGLAHHSTVPAPWKHMGKEVVDDGEEPSSFLNTAPLSRDM